MASCGYHVEGSHYVISGFPKEKYGAAKEAIEAARSSVGTVYQVRKDGTKFQFWSWKQVHKAEEKKRKKAKF